MSVGTAAERTGGRGLERELSVDEQRGDEGKLHDSQASHDRSPTSRLELFSAAVKKLSNLLGLNRLACPGIVPLWLLQNQVCVVEAVLLGLAVLFAAREDAGHREGLR